MNKKIRVAVMGYGYLGKWHCEKVQQCPLAQLVNIVEPDPTKKKLINQLYPQVKVTTDVSEVLAEIDAVLIVTPTSTHFKLMQKLLQAGKHVFCEKPVCETTEEVENLQKLARENKNLIIQVGHSERCHQAWEIMPQNRSLQPLLKSILFIQVERLAPFKGRATDVDVVQDLMIHDLDLLYFLFQEMPTSVQAVGHCSLTKHWDFVSASLFFPSGKKAIINVGRNHVEEIRTWNFHGTQGAIQVDLAKFNIRWIENNQIQHLAYEKRDHLLFEQQKFYSSIIDKTPVMVGLDDAARAVIMVNAILKSLQLKQPVDLHV